MQQNILHHNQVGTGSRYAKWKKSFLVVFYAIVAITYGFAIYTINRPPDRIVEPVLERYGKWRFLTYNDLVLQFVTFTLCLLAEFFPNLRKVRDFLFTTLALPVGIFVVSCFWSVWHIAGRENILPVESGCPDWLNHISHTIMAPINLIQVILVKHSYLSDVKAIASLLAYLMAYNSYLLFIRYRTGLFVYKFMNKMSPLMVGLFIVAMILVSILFYKLGKLLHDAVHRAKSQPVSEAIVVSAYNRPQTIVTIANGQYDDTSNNHKFSIT